jgi:hypothetical protein
MIRTTFGLCISSALNLNYFCAYIGHFLPEASNMIAFREHQMEVAGQRWLPAAMRERAAESVCVVGNVPDAKMV